MPPTDLVLHSVFPEAFVEYVMLDVIDIPSVSVPLPRLETDVQRVLQAFSDRWCESVGGAGQARANTQLLIIGDTDGIAPQAGPNAGLTINKVASETSSFVFRATINDVAGKRRMNADSWAMKTCAHEIAHQWKTNTAWQLLDHCATTTTAYNSQAVYCLLAASDLNLAEAQRDNGIATFHMTQLPGDGPWHSEYLEIRRAADPFVP